jgi:hypothetical protein
MKIVGAAIKGLKKDKTLFARVVANAERIEETGSRIERGAATSIAGDADVFAKRLSSEAYSSGLVREKLKQAARELKNGSITIGDASARVLSALRSTTEENGAGGIGARGRSTEPTAEAGQPTATEAGPEGTQQTLIPGVKAVTDRDRIEAAARAPLHGGNAAMQHGGLFGDAKDQQELFQKNQSEKPKLTKKTIDAAIQNYSGGHAISANVLLRKGEDAFKEKYSPMGSRYRGQVQKTIDAMDQMATPLTEGTTLYRAMPIAADAKPGDVLTDRGFSSTATSKGTPALLAQDRGQMLVKINAPKGAPVIDFKNRGSDVNEIVLPRGNQLRIKSIDGNTVDAELIPHNPGEVNENFSQDTKGKINIVAGQKSVITLFKGADASTPIHELGHDFLEQLRRDSAHEKAPEQIRADWQTVKRALKIADDAKRIQTPAHEQFARWFEQYLYEGRAPSKELAGVFARFKNWLANIYKSVKDIFDRRQIPMSEDIRRVFDRMLAEDPVATTIVPEIPRATSLHDIHAAEADRVPAVDAGATAERIASERAEIVPPTEVEHEIAPKVAEVEAGRAAAGSIDAAGETGRGDARLRKMDGGSGEAGVEPDRVGMGAESGEKRESGNATAPESFGTATGGSTAGRSESSGAVRNAPLAAKPAELLTPRKRFVDKAGNIRLDNVNSAEDLKELAREIAASNNDFIGNRRGVISDAELMTLQAALGDDRITRKTLGQAFNAEEAVAVQRIAAQAWREMHDAAQGFKQTRSDADLLAYIEKQQRATMMQAYYSQATAEAGRALRAMRKVQEFWTPGGEGAKAATEGAPKPKPGDIVAQATGRTLFQKAQEALLVAEYENPQSAARFNTWTQRHSFGRMILEYWINGLISGTATHTTYMVGNTILALEKGLLETPVAAAIGALRPAMGREGGNVVRFGEAAARLKGIATGYAPAVTASLEAFRSGVTGRLPGEEEGRRLPFQPEGAPPIVGAVLNESATMRDAKLALYGATRGILDGMLSIGKILQAAPQGSPWFSTEYSGLGATPNFRAGAAILPVGTLVRLPSRAIASIHTFFRAMNYSMEKNAEVYRQAVAEGEAKGWSQSQIHTRIAELTNNTPEDIVSASTHGATDMTLMGPAGEFTRRLQALTNWAPNIPGFGETPVFKFVDPFIHIASNIIDQSIVQRTPVGLLSSELRRDLMGKNGVAAQDMAQARMIVGSALSLGFGALAAGGYVTGSGPTDRTKAAMWRMVYQPHSVRIGDMWFQMNRLGPLGMLLSTSADLYDVAHAASQGDMLAAAAQLQHAITQNVLDESFMRGPADLIQAVEDPGRYGERYIQNFAASFVPYSVGLAQMDRASDPFTRQARNVVDAIKQKIPGMSETLFPKRDVWGMEIPNHDALVAAGVTAIYEQRMSQDPVNIALAQMGIGIAPVDRTIRNVKLTDQQYDDFARVAGRLLKMRLDAIVRSPDWQQWPVGVKADWVKLQTEHSREAARGWMFMKYPQILADATRQKMQKLRAEP